MKNLVMQIVRNLTDEEDARIRTETMSCMPGYVAAIKIKEPNGTFTVQYLFDVSNFDAGVSAGQREVEVNMSDFTAFENNITTIDIEQDFWNSIKAAAAKSKWIPQEHYFMNDWVSDVCTYLKEGK